MYGNPNILAYLALFLWAPVTGWLFHKLSPARAAAWSIVGAVLFLPEVVAVDPPLLPPIDKTSMAAFWCLIGCIWKGRGRLQAARPFRGIDLFFVVVLLGNVATSLTNGDVLITGPVVRPPLGLYDSVALGIKDTLAVYLPFFIGRAMLRTREDLRMLTKLFVTAGVAYSFLALIEIRLSPQLHKWIYGFYQMDFSMTIRLGGYRPMIFMATGMAVAMFILGASLMAIARYRVGMAKGYVPLFLIVVTAFCKSSGALVYGLVVWPLLFVVRRPKMWVPAFLATMVILYPALRAFDLFPADYLVEKAEAVNEERALSLWFRFDQEKQLLDRANERLWFGWGGYDRNRIFDTLTGEDLSVTDGDWAIQYGMRGVVGFAGLYCLLVVPILLLWRRLGRIRSLLDRRLLTALALFSSLLTVDLLPNGLFNCLPFFLAGAVHGLMSGIVKSQPSRKRRRA